MGGLIFLHEKFVMNMLEQPDISLTHVRTCETIFLKNFSSEILLN